MASPLQTRRADDEFVFKVLRDGQSEPLVLSKSVKELHLDRLDGAGPLELISALRRTRSGRLVRPPLDTWRGQYMDVDGSDITVCPGSETDLVRPCPGNRNARPQTRASFVLQIYLKWLGLKPSPQDDSGYRSPPRKGRRGRRGPTRGATSSFNARRRQTRGALASSRARTRRRERVTLSTLVLPDSGSSDDSPESLRTFV